ncbi:MAG TPA: DUF501 domain-containing protein [Desertimonas sp.]|nr:DUF501 domain-containing protein [Desertimonas sp.]
MPVATTVDDDERVAELLGRRPAGRYTVVVRGRGGDPVVIRNAPFLDDGTPMPTRYWLVGRDEVVAVSRLEAAGGVGAAEAAVDAAELAEAHARYAAERDLDVRPDTKPRPAGGVGGTRQGVKCLHAHYAWHLAGGDDPVGKWVAAQLSTTLAIHIAGTITVLYGAGRSELPTTIGELLGELDDADPPSPQSLTNAIGAITDDIDNLLRAEQEVGERRTLEFTGDEAWHLAVVERGAPPDPAVARLTLDRNDVEDLFRTLATERRRDRLHNPALEPQRVDSILATCCVVLAVMRRLQFAGAVAIRPASGVH